MGLPTLGIIGIANLGNMEIHSFGIDGNFQFPSICRIIDYN